MIILTVMKYVCFESDLQECRQIVNYIFLYNINWDSIKNRAFYETSWWENNLLISKASMMNKKSRVKIFYYMILWLVGNHEKAA